MDIITLGRSNPPYKTEQDEYREIRTETLESHEGYEMFTRWNGISYPCG